MKPTVLTKKAWLIIIGKSQITGSAFMQQLFNHRTTVERETARRIRAAVAAYAYEIADAPIISDSGFDELAGSIDISISTTRPDLDTWFKREFQPHTGQWIYRHPELQKVRDVYERYYRTDRISHG